jgi:hypothetical protein
MVGGSAPRKAATCTRKYKYRKTQTYVYALSGIRTHDPSVQWAKTLRALDHTVNINGAFSLAVINVSLIMTKGHTHTVSVMLCSN